MRKPFLTFDRVVAGMAVAIAIVATLVVTLPTGAGVVSAPSGSLSAAGVATNKILRTAADGTLTDVIIGSGLSMGADGTLSSSGGGGGGGGGAPAVSYVALPSYGHIGGSTLGYSTNLTALSAGMMLVPTNLLGTNRYFVQWRAAGQAMAFSNYQAINFTGAGRGAYASSRTNAGFYELQIWRDDISGETNATLAGFEYGLAFAGGASATTNELTGQVTLTTGGIPAETALTNSINLVSNLAVAYRPPAISYVALPPSMIVGGAILAYSTNLSANATLIASNLLGTNRYLVQWYSTGQKLTFSDSAAWYFADRGLGGYSESSTNAGLNELTLWKDVVSGRTNAIYRGPEYVLAFGTNLVVSTNELTGTVTVSGTSGGSQTPWSSDIDGAGFKLAGVKNLVVSGTNIAGAATNNAVVLTNTLPAATNLQMGSPMLKMYGSGFRTTGSGGSNVMMQGLDVLPIQGTTTPTSKMRFLASTNDQTPVEVGYINSSGLLFAKGGVDAGTGGLTTAGGVVVAGLLTMNVGNQIQWNNGNGDILVRHKGSGDYNLEVAVAGGTALPTSISVGGAAATPGNGRLKPGDAIGTDIAGSTLEVTGGRSTGTGASGDLLFSTTTNNVSSSSTTNGLVTRMQVYGNHGMVGHHFGTFYRSNSITFIPTAAQLGVGGYWTGNSNGNLVAVYSLNGTTTAMKVLAP